MVTNTKTTGRSTTTPVKPSPKSINIGTVGKIIITEEVQNIIDYLHKKVGSTEWSGILYYKLTKGDIKTLKNLEFTAEFIYPMNIGSTAYTEFDYSGEVMNACDIKEDVIDCSSGLVHSHHNMSTFFSGTDTSELKENAVHFNYYVSLIVNFDGKYCAKIALPSESEITTKLSLKDSLGKLFNKRVKQTETTIVIGDLDIVKPENSAVPTWLVDRYEELSKPKTYPSFYSNKYDSSNRVLPTQRSLYEDDDWGYGYGYKTPSYTAKPTDYQIEQFLVSLIQLDSSKKFIGLKKSLTNIDKLPEEEINVWDDAISTNLEIIYEQIFLSDKSMANISSVCEKALEKLEAFYNTNPDLYNETISDVMTFNLSIYAAA